MNYSAHEVLTYVDVSAASIGISSSFSFYFVAIANAGSLLGRYVAGYMSDRLGKTKLFVPFFLIGRQYLIRSNEHYDTLYGGGWDINLRMAIRQDEIVASRVDGSLRVMIFPKADCLTGLTDRHTRCRFASGSYISLLANPMMDLGDTHDVGRRLGMFLSIMSFGALAGPPISGAINTATGGFTAVGVYAGKR